MLRAEPTATVEAYMKANGLGFRNIADDGQKLHDAFEVSALPALLLFDRQGRLVKRFSDELSAEDLRSLTTRIGLFQVELGHLIAHAVPADAQEPGRLGLVPVSLLQSVYQ